MFQLVPLQGLGIAFILIVLLFALVATGLWIYAAYWVFNDANDRGMDSAMLWALITFFTGLIGLVVYFIVREDRSAPAIQ